jgi:GNAT superfamily N-acetyltransferase
MLARARSEYRKRFANQNYIFQHSGPFADDTRRDCEFNAYHSAKEIPPQIVECICESGTAARFETDKLELSENAVLWIATVDGDLASSVFTRRGLHFRNWFVSLRPDDLVVFRLKTESRYRGCGIAPSLMRYALKRSMLEQGSAYIDCRTYNTASIRCIEKAGFKRIAKIKTIRRDWALYGT